MARPQLVAGELGSITIHDKDANGGRSYQARAYYRDAGGLLRKLSATAKTKTAAKALLIKRHEELIASGTASGERTPTVADAVKLYMGTKRVQAPGSKVSGPDWITSATMRQYQNSAKLAVELLGAVKLHELTVMYAQKQLSSLINPETLEGATAAKHARGVLIRAIDHARRMGLSNVENVIKSTRLASKGVAAVTAPSLSDLDLLRSIFAWRFDSGEAPGRAPYERVRWVTELMLETAMRIGEVLALRWCDVDFNARLVEISGTLKEDGPLHRQGYAKTESSHAFISISEEMCALLERLYEESKFKEPEDPVFATTTGKHVAPTAIRRALNGLLREHQQVFSAKIHPHAFRRAVATMLNEAVGLEAAAEQLRHTDSRTTQRHYVQRKVVVTNRMAALDGLNRGRTLGR